MSDEIFERLEAFIYKEGFGYTLPFPFLIKKKPITKELSLDGDLKITGDDADEFLIAFGKEFNVDISKFIFSDYFGDEGDPVLPSIIRGLSGKKKIVKKELKIIHLIKAIGIGRLDEEVINS